MGIRGRSPNALLVDLAAQIALARENFPKAEEYIDELSRLKRDGEYHHRYATYLNARKRFSEALYHARRALEVTKKRRFEVNAILVDTLIELGSYEEASQLLDDLDSKERRAPDTRDVRYGLHCKFYLRQGNWKEAEAMWREIEEKENPVHLALRAEVLAQKMADLTVSPGQRESARKELESLKVTHSLAHIGLLSVSDEDDGPNTITGL